MEIHYGQHIDARYPVQSHAIPVSLPRSRHPGRIVVFHPGAPRISAAQEGTSNVLTYRGEQPVRARHGMVVSVHHLASDAGVQIMQQGGNAVDAAVATGFALAVVHPIAGNLGGGGFLLLRTHDGKATFIDFREKAPMAATETMYQDAHGNIIPTTASSATAPSQLLAPSPDWCTRKRNTESSASSASWLRRSSWRATASRSLPRKRTN